MGTTEIVSTTTPSTPVYASGISHFGLHSMRIDAGYHTTPQPNSDSAKTHVVKIGEKGDGTIDVPSSVACSDFRVSNLEITGGVRHGIEVGCSKDTSAPSERGVIERCISTDGAGDDDFCIGGPCRKITYRSCYSINRLRNGVWQPSCFEMDDGPRQCYFVDCHAIEPAQFINGFIVGKSHSWATIPNGDNYVNGCSAVGTNHGFKIPLISGATGTVENINFTDCTARDNGKGLVINAAGPLKDVTVKGGYYTGGGVIMDIAAVGDSMEDIKLDTTVDGATDSNLSNVQITSDNATVNGVRITGEIKNAAGHGVEFVPTNGGTFETVHVTGADITDNGGNPVYCGGDESNWSGLNTVRDNYCRGNGAAASVGVGNPSTRRHVVAQDNFDADDEVSVEPNAPSGSRGLWYVDDGSNGGAGVRRYNGSSWGATSSTFGESGDIVYLYSTGTIGGNKTVTSTSYAYKGDFGVIPFQWFDSLTNISQLYVSYPVQVANDTAGETTTSVIQLDGTNITATEVSHTGDGFTRAHSTRAPVSYSTPTNAQLYAKVTGGSGTLQQAAKPNVIVWGEVA
jgi:hypothetical protein